MALLYLLFQLFGPQVHAAPYDFVLYFLEKPNYFDEKEEDSPPPPEEVEAESFVDRNWFSSSKKAKYVQKHGYGDQPPRLNRFGKIKKLYLPKKFLSNYGYNIGAAPLFNFSNRGDQQGAAAFVNFWRDSGDFFLINLSLTSGGHSPKQVDDFDRADTKSFYFNFDFQTFIMTPLHITKNENLRYPLIFTPSLHADSQGDDIFVSFELIGAYLGWGEGNVGGANVGYTNSIRQNKTAKDKEKHIPVIHGFLVMNEYSPIDFQFDTRVAIDQNLITQINSLKTHFSLHPLKKKIPIGIFLSAQSKALFLKKRNLKDAEAFMGDFQISLDNQNLYESAYRLRDGKSEWDVTFILGISFSHKRNYLE
tara:strand:- start:994 stop:2085 length:1092 start_codon:yes stop_codon:yes gene_type:complete